MISALRLARRDIVREETALIGVTDETDPRTSWRRVMAQDQAKPSGPDLAQGIALAELQDGRMLVGHAAGEQVLLVRRGTEVFAVGALCTHYHGPLVDGLVVDDTVRCPWHHACFDLRTGEALRAPALNPVPAWNVERRGDRVVVTTKRELPPPRPRAATVTSVGIVGAGAAGAAACEMLRRRGFTGEIGRASCR